MRLLFVPIILALVILGTGRSARGQSSSDVITGRVMDASGAPVAGAQVTAVSAESEMRRSAQTNQQGRFTIVFADGSGMYQLTVSFPGMAPYTRVVRRPADEEVLVANIRMDAAPVLL